MDAHAVSFSDTVLLASFGRIALFAAAGVAMGLLHFSALRGSARRFVEGAPVWRMVGAQLLRMTFTLAMLAACALAGALPLVASLGGLLLGRACVLRRARAA